MRRAAALASMMALAACQTSAPPAHPHYVLGGAYQAGGFWFYPHETFDMEQTGIATVAESGAGRLTADGEVFDQGAMAAAHQTLQLPAIVRVTNLQNGLSTEVRVNDRGPASPHRVVAVTRRVAELLQFPADGAAPVRLTVLGGPSRVLVEQLGGGDAPRLALSSAPVADVQASDLPPPPNVASMAGREIPAGPVAAAVAAPGLAGAEVPLRLPETLTREAVGPIQLWVVLGTFSRYEYANLQRARVGGLSARIEERRTGRSRSYTVRVGPFAVTPQADAAMDQAIRAGVTDARIVVE